MCRWLRLLGFKTHYAGVCAGDDEVIKSAISKRAVLLTRDEELARKARDYCPCLLVHSNDLHSQLKEVMLGLNLELPKTAPNDYCPECGGNLKRVPKSRVKERVWPRVYSRNEEFKECNACGKLYWPGSHLREMNRVLKGLS